MYIIHVASFDEDGSAGIFLKVPFEAFQNNILTENINIWEQPIRGTSFVSGIYRSQEKYSRTSMARTLMARLPRLF